MQIGHVCDVGKERQLNEDSLMWVWLTAKFQTGSVPAGLFVVADGMGGHSAGEVASEWGIRIFAKECLSRLLDPAGGTEAEKGSQPADLKDILEYAVKVANSVLFQWTKENEALHGMGTTITSGLIVDQDLYIVHVGDSRCYIVNTRETIQLTKDHSLIQEMVDSGLITSEEARVHPKKNIITRVVGYYQDIDVDVNHYKLYQGDNILLCSDGLWGVLPDRHITEVVLTAETPQFACEQLAARANASGGPDNISVIVVRPEGLPSWQEVLTADTEIGKTPGESQCKEEEPKKTQGKLRSIFRWQKTSTSLFPW